MIKTLRVLIAMNIDGIKTFVMNLYSNNDGIKVNVIGN